MQITKRRIRKSASLALAAATVSAMALFTAPSASAASFTFNTEFDAMGNAQVTVKYGSKVVGGANWVRDPVGDWSGDTMCVWDSSSDGSYLTGDTSAGHHVSTKGHSAPSPTLCDTVNVAEDSKMVMTICIGTSDMMCSRGIGIYA